MRGTVGLSFLISLHFFSLAADFVAAEETTPNLTIAQLRYELAMRNAKDGLFLAIDQQLESALSKGDIELARSHVVAKLKFTTENLIPTDNYLREASVLFATARRSADLELVTAWRTEIEAAEKSGNSELIAKLKRDMEEFIQREKGQIAAAQIRLEQASGLEARSKKICDTLQKLVAKHSEVMEDAKKRNSGLNKVNSQKLFMEEANRLLKGERWTVNCRITEIKPSHQVGYYVLGIEPAIEISSLSSEWRSRISWSVALTRERAERVQPGDTLEISGSPVFAEGNQGLVSRPFSTLESFPASYTVALNNARTNVQHQVQP